MTNETDEWDWDSWLEIRGPYDNVVFKSVFWGGVFRLSLAMPIEKNAEWRWSTTFVSNWYTNMDESWYSSVSGSYPSTNAPHYFYRVFSGSSFMAAYELRISYRYGVVAYINGIEVYRDNMPVGPVLPTTKSTTSYVYYQYRGTIRNGYEVSAENNILAIEVHTSSRASIEFDAWLALYSSSDTFNGNQACYPVVPTSAIWSDGFNMANICDFSTSTAVSVNAFSPGLNYVEFSIPTAQITSFSILFIREYPYYSNMQWQAYDTGSGVWSDYYVTSMMATSQLYVDMTMGDSKSPNSNKIRFYPLKASGLPTSMIEYIPRVCHLVYSTEQKIPQFKEQYELKNHEFISIQPVNWNNTSTCTSSPPLPDGLSFKACSIEGTPSSLMEQSTYTIFVYDVMGTKYRIVKLAVVESVPNDGDKSPGIMIIILIVVIVVILVVVIALIVKKRPTKLRIAGGTGLKVPDNSSRSDNNRTSNDGIITLGDDQSQSGIITLGDNPSQGDVVNIGDPSQSGIVTLGNNPPQGDVVTIGFDQSQGGYPPTPGFDQSQGGYPPTPGFDQSQNGYPPTSGYNPSQGDVVTIGYNQSQGGYPPTPGFDQATQYDRDIVTVASNSAYVLPPNSPGYSVITNTMYANTPNNRPMGTPLTYASTPNNPTGQSSSQTRKVSVLNPPIRPSNGPQEIGRSLLYSNPGAENYIVMDSVTNPQNDPNTVVNSGAMNTQHMG